MLPPVDPVAAAPVRPLAGLVVLDLTQFAAGPYCTMLLGDAGARILKVEPPGRGDPYRHEGPDLRAPDGSTTGAFFLRFGRGKESVTLDLKSEAGRRIFERLVPRVDVLVENFKADTMDRLGLGYARLSEISPRLVYASITGFGHTDIYQSPYWRRPAFAIVAEAMGGVMDRIGDATCPPHWSGVSAGDLYAGGLALSGILMAICQRDRTGRGQHVDISMVDAMISLNERAVFSYSVANVVPVRGPEPDLTPFGAFRARDGYLVIGVIGSAVWSRFCQAIGRPELLEDERLASGLGRRRHLETIIAPAIERWLSDKTKSEATEILLAHDVPAAPIYDARDVVESPHVAARRMLVDVEYGAFGKFRVAGTPIKLGADAEPEPSAVPGLGEHTDAVLGELLGLTVEERAALRAEGVI